MELERGQVRYSWKGVSAKGQRVRSEGQRVRVEVQACEG